MTIGVQELQMFLVWCTVINAGVLMVSFLMIACAGDWIYRIHGRWFPMSREMFYGVLYAFLGGYKMCILMFNVVPLLALVIIK